MILLLLDTVMFNYDFGDTAASHVDAELTWFDSQLTSSKADGTVY
jgi:hypothetical protein